MAAGGGLAAGGRDDPDVATDDALIAHETADEGDGFAVGRPAGNGDLEAVERTGNVGGSEDGGGRGRRVLSIASRRGCGGRWCVHGQGGCESARVDGLRVELGDPPVVLAGRIGGDAGEGFGIGRPVELVDVEVGRRDKSWRGGFRDAGGDECHALDVDMIFSDDAGGRCFGGERSGRPRGALDVEKGDGLSVGREGGRVDVAMQVADAAGRTAVEMREIEVGLLAGVCAIGEESDGGGAWRPDELGRVAGLTGCSGSDRKRLREAGVRGDMELTRLKPGDALAIGRDGDLGDEVGAALMGEDFVEARGGRRGGLRRGGGGLREGVGGCAESAGHCQTPEGAMEARHGEMVRQGPGIRKTGT